MRNTKYQSNIGETLLESVEFVLCETAWHHTAKNVNGTRNEAKIMPTAYELFRYELLLCNDCISNFVLSILRHIRVVVKET